MKTKKDLLDHSKCVGVCSHSKAAHTPTPWYVTGVTVHTHGNAGANEITAVYSGEANAAFIVRACNAHEELLEAAKNSRNVLAGLITGDLKTVPSNSPALRMLRDAIARAEGGK